MANEPAMRKIGLNSSNLRRMLPINVFEETVYSVAYVMVRDNDLPPKISWLLSVCRTRVHLSRFSWNDVLCASIHVHCSTLLGILLKPIDSRRYPAVGICCECSPIQRSSTDCAIFFGAHVPCIFRLFRLSGH
jgi:hypothetical protein